MATGIGRSRKGRAPLSAEEIRFREVLSDYLQDELMARGWNQSELARRVGIQLGNKNFSRDNISKYLQQKSSPSLHHFGAIARALGQNPNELRDQLHTKARIDEPEEEPGHGHISFVTLDDGRVQLNIGKPLPFDLAIRIMSMIQDYEAGRVVEMPPALPAKTATSRPRADDAETVVEAAMVALSEGKVTDEQMGLLRRIADGLSRPRDDATDGGPSIGPTSSAKRRTSKARA